MLFFPGLLTEVNANCCPNGSIEIDASSETLSTSSLPGNYYNGLVCIKNGMLEVDINYTFEYAELHFENNAGLHVQGGVTLEISKSLLTACEQNGMWESVVGDNNSVIIVSNSTIEQAYQAFFLSSGFSFTAIDNEFLNNYISITVTSGKGGANFEVYGNLFTSDGNFDATAYSFSYDKPFTAFRINTGSTVTIGSSSQGADFNIIENTYHGIYGTSAQISVVKTLFRHIQPNSSLSGADGIGIYIRGYNELSILNVMGTCVYDENYTLPDFNDGPAYNFWEVHRAIVADSSHVNIDRNCIILSTNGIELYRSPLSTGYIGNNEILAHSMGIYLLNNAPMNSIKIENNVIGIGFHDPGSGYTQGLYGIGVRDNTAGNYIGEIRNNSIRFLKGTGIFLHGTQNWDVIDNAVSNSDEHAPTVKGSQGIFIGGCEDINLNCNVSVGSTYEGHNYLGIFVLQSENTVMQCNVVEDVNTGVYFYASCPGTEFKGTLIGSSETGLHLHESAIIGEQHHHGNLWVGAPYNISALHESNDQTFTLFSQFFVNGNTFPIYPENFVAPGSNDWFEDAAGNTFLCEEEMLSCMAYAFKPEGDNELNLSLELLTNNYQMPFHEAGQKTLHRQHYYNLLRIAGVDMLAYEADTFLQNGMSDEREIYYQRALILRQFPYHTALSSQDEWMEGIRNNLKENNDQSLNDSLFALVTNLSSDMNQLWQEKLASTVDLNNSLMLSDNPVYYYSGKMGNLFVKHFSDSLDYQDVAQLLQVAIQCPYDIGNAAYGARNILLAYDIAWDFNDDVLCAPAIYEELRPAELDQLTSVLYPNPSRGQFTVKAEGEFLIEIYDTRGKLVSKVENQIDEAIIAHELPNGVYLVKVLTAEKTYEVHTLLVLNN